MYKYFYMFTEKFYRILTDDIASLSNKPRPHHHAPVRGIDRKDLKEVPEVHRSPLTGPDNKIMVIQKSIAKKMPVNNNDINHYIKKYNLSNIVPGKPKQCGTTGISLLINDPNHTTGILYKQ
jgi:hypothetical protein